VIRIYSRVINAHDKVAPGDNAMPAIVKDASLAKKLSTSDAHPLNSSVFLPFAADFMVRNAKGPKLMQSQSNRTARTCERHRL
jgi:hypothetical protein